jgi:hypothetical protein
VGRFGKIQVTQGGLSWVSLHCHSFDVDVK